MLLPCRAYVCHCSYLSMILASGLNQSHWDLQFQAIRECSEVHLSDSNKRSAPFWPLKQYFYSEWDKIGIFICTQTFLEVGLRLSSIIASSSPSSRYIQPAHLCPWAHAQMLLWDVLVTVAHVVVPSLLAGSYWCLWRCPTATLLLTLHISSYRLLLVTCVEPAELNTYISLLIKLN